jgi:hypothetical protein
MVCEIVSAERAKGLVHRTSWDGKQCPLLSTTWTRTISIVRNNVPGGQNQFQGWTYLGKHVWGGGGGGCHLDRCEVREAYASRMKGAGFSRSADPQRQGASIGDVAQMAGSRRITVEVAMCRFV